MRRMRQDHRELELRLGASISVHRLSGYGRKAGLKRVSTGAYSSDVRAATNFRGAEKSGSGWEVDILWPDGETEVVKGFITEHDAAKWIAEHSHANVPAARYRQGSS